MTITLLLRSALLSGGLLWLVGPAHGQPAAPKQLLGEVPQYRFYAGLAYSIQSYQTVSPDGGIRYIRVVGVEPVYAYVGYQLNPYLAVQVGFCQRNPLTEDETRSGVFADGRAYTSFFHSYRYDAAVPVQVRYRLTRRQQQRLHCAALLGVATVFHRDIAENHSTIAGQTTYTSFSNERSTNFYLTSYLALGYAIGRCEALGELGASINLETLKYEGVGRITPGLDLGLRYTFGRVR